MKRFLIIVSIFIFSTSFSFGQIGKSNFDFYFDIGYATIFFDGVSGPLIGLTLVNEKHDFGFSIRNDMLISLGRDEYIDVNGLLFVSEKIEILQYNVLTYWEGYLGLKRFIKVPLSLGYELIQGVIIGFTSFDCGFKCCMHTIKLQVTHLC